jgi:hypothetical protein
MKIPLALREQIGKIGEKILAGDTDRVTAVDLLERWVFKNAAHIAHALVRDWARERVNNWLKVRLREEANRRVRPPEAETLFDLLQDAPSWNIEIGVGRFVDLVDATRPELLAWQKQAHVKRDNVTDYSRRVDAVVECLIPRMTDDTMRAGEALRSMVASRAA